MALDLWSGLVGFWSFDEGIGVYTDDKSENSNICYLNNTDDTNWVLGKSATAVYLDGISQYVHCHDHSSMNMGIHDFSISMWIKPSSFGYLQTYVSKYKSIGGPLDPKSGWYICCDDISPHKKITFKYLSKNGTIRMLTSNTELIADEWFHVVVVHENIGQDYIYINNVLDNSAVSYSENVDCTSEFRMGFNDLLYLSSIFDEVRLYNRVLSTVEINALNVNPGGEYIDLVSDLVGHWGFSEGYGTITTMDESVNSNDGTLNNMDDNDWVNGVCGTAIKFNGTDIYVNCGHDSSLDITGNFTISAWIKLDLNATGCNYVLCKRGTSDTDMQYGVMWSDTANALKCGFENAWRGSTAPNAILPGWWYHVGIVYNQVDIRYYIDGMLSEVPYVTSGSITSDTHDFIVGKCNPANCHFDGIIDEIRIYNRDLSVTEIKALHKTPCVDQGQLTSYKFIVTDISGTDHEITDGIQNIDLDYVLSNGADTFSFTITNELDQYAYIEKGCKIRIMYGIGGANEIRLVGIIKEANKTLEGALVLAMIEVSGEDWTNRLNHIYFTDRYYNIEVSNVVKAILDSIDYTTGKTYRELAEINEDYSYICTTDYTFDNASFVWSSLSSALKELAEAVGFEWYVDTNKRVHFYDPYENLVSSVIVDDDIHSAPVIGTYKEIVNRVIVVGGYKQAIDLVEGPYSLFTPVTEIISCNESFVPNENFISSVFMYTDPLDLTSNMTLSIQEDNAGIPSGENIANGYVTINHDRITDGGYTEFRFENHVTVTPGIIYYMVIHGTSTPGVNIRVDGSYNLDYNTRFPYRIAIISNDVDSQKDYGMFTAVHRDEGIEDEMQAELIAEEMLNGYPKSTADIMMYGTKVGIGDTVKLTISKIGVSIDKNMKVISNSHSVGHRHIYNSLELKEQ